MPIKVDVKINQGALNQMLKSPTGEVGVYIHRLAVETVRAAQAHAPVKSGNLRRSIGISLWPGPRLSAEVTANVSYAMAVHQGTTAHVIQGNPVMAFPRKGGGPMVVVSKVHAKATKGNPFLVKALREVVAMRI